MALLLVALAGAVLLTHSSVRPQWLFRESLSPRRDVFDAGVSIFRDHPLFGGGPGTFGLLYPQYSGEFPIHAIHAHNGFLQLADDAGSCRPGGARRPACDAGLDALAELP